MTAPAGARPAVDVDEDVAEDRPWVTIVWNDPVNLMSYVTHVLMELFGYTRDKATELMLDVHHKGRAVVSNGTREQMEADVAALPRQGPVGHPAAGLTCASPGPARGCRATRRAGEARVLRRCALDLLELLGERRGPRRRTRSPRWSACRPATRRRPTTPRWRACCRTRTATTTPRRAAEFRRYTDADLRARKRADAEVVARIAARRAAARSLLDRDEADAWLGCLNDLRLVLGTRLEVTEDLDEDALERRRRPAAGRRCSCTAGSAGCRSRCSSCLEPASIGCAGC